MTCYRHAGTEDVISALRFAVGSVCCWSQLVATSLSFQSFLERYLHVVCKRMADVTHIGIELFMKAKTRQGDLCKKQGENCFVDSCFTLM